MGKLLTFDFVKSSKQGGREVGEVAEGVQGNTHTHTGMSKRKEIHTHFLRVVSVQINNILSFCESCLPSCWFAFQSRRYCCRPPPQHHPLLSPLLSSPTPPPSPLFLLRYHESSSHTSHCCRGRKGTSLFAINGFR